jgi:sporulation protein YlmC with PRC-barrel domain
MKRKLQIIITASAASVLAFSALAQETPSPKMAEAQSNSQGGIQACPIVLKDTAKASDIIGMTVKNYQHEKLGTVKDLAVDVGSGRIVQVIISSGGFLGMDVTLTPVPPGALYREAGQKVLHLDASREKFDAAPKCDTAEWDANTQSNRVTEVYSYYGEYPYFVDNGNGYLTNTFANTLPRNADGSINTDGARTMDKANNVKIAQNVEATDNWISTLNTNGTWSRTYYLPGQSFSKLGYVQEASKLMGAPVNNLQNENIGQVQDFIVDLSGGRIVAVIIASGGYLGMDNEFSAVPPAALRLNAGDDALVLDTTKEKLAGSPHFNGNQWPDFNQPAYAGGVYSAYNVEPYFTTDTTNVSDNSTLASPGQGNSEADVDTTAQIHQEIIADSEMSLNARNVEIVTMDGHVTLRGPVDSQEEKSQIGDIANSIAHAGNVDNQLEVVMNTTTMIN